MIHEPGTTLFTTETPRAVDCAVLVICREDNVAFLQTERAGYDVQPIGNIGDECQIIARDVDESAEFFSGRRQQFGSASSQKVAGICFQLSLPVLIAIEDRTRHGAKAAMIEIDDIRVEQVLFGEMWKGQRERHSQAFL